MKKIVSEVLNDYSTHEFDNVFIFQNGQYNHLHQYNLSDYADCKVVRYAINVEDNFLYIYLEEEIDY